MSPTERIDQIAASLAAHNPGLFGGPEPARALRTRPGDAGMARASVALVVRPGESDVELLFIKRATFAGDPWSGHMALPGGRRAPGDRSSLETAIREAREEVGIDLRRDGRAVGRLDDVEPRSGAPSIVVSPFVFSVGSAARARPNAEVALAMWIELGHLAGPASATEYLHALASGAHLRFPAIAYQEHVIWGITHRIIRQFLEVALMGPQQGRTG